MSRRLIFAFIACLACEGGKGGGIPPTDGTGSGIDCGGLAGAQCPANEFCDFSLNSCGFSDESGTCRSRPSGCPELFRPTCGCDGQIHGNACDANAAGVDISDVGGCDAGPDQFACGHIFCNLADNYCERTGSDIGGEPASFQCKLLPAACDVDSTCACLAGEPCGSECIGNPARGFEVVCFGG